MILYRPPIDWISYDLAQITPPLIEAKAAALALTQIPYQRSWIEPLQQLQLKREIAGTSRIEGAEFTEKELDAALNQPAEKLFTRSQRQAKAALNAYNWIQSLPADRPVNGDLVKELHRKIVTGADDDHCAPGELRRKDQNVIFGIPSHRGSEGGEECQRHFDRLMQAASREFSGHDLFIQALAFHYHFAAMHPFLDGNGRTARALEALILQRAGLRAPFFISMSNFYYDEKERYLTCLSETRACNHHLTAFILFGLEGIKQQCHRVLEEIRLGVAKELFRNTMYRLYHRLESSRKRALATRQLAILKLLLDSPLSMSSLQEKTHNHYAPLKAPLKALIRDLLHLMSLGAIHVASVENVSINLDWPKEISESGFLEKISQMPSVKGSPFAQ